MYILCSDGWKMRVSEHEVFTPGGYRQLCDLRVGDKLKGTEGKMVEVAGFLNEWQVFVSEYGAVNRSLGFVFAPTTHEALIKAEEEFGAQLREINREVEVQHYFVVIGQEEPFPGPRPTVWSRLRNPEV